MADINAIAQQFTDFYYKTFDQDRGQLTPLYRNESMLTWEGQQFQGVQTIVEKLMSLPFQKVVHQVTKFDAQPSSIVTPNLLVSVTGHLLVDDETNPLPFSQVFQLIQDTETGSYYVFNDIFRLNLG
ncbi:nuclear transport factor 2 [Fomitiporia mediterranea MF3/22]|uniref:nuclear transport factor 2 n=1 Tax=Fomitiporia mediterranea (strain MF3/22) TaxID=694068 RepID=UPI000440890A|nr:nuclear transport factor 2 [Fomitiporia mediterranea MF3/22]EJD06119.1 nuclear transport factor 2 [Fomitiporia mediterranea MF3/22]